MVHPYAVGEGRGYGVATKMTMKKAKGKVWSIEIVSGPQHVIGYAAVSATFPSPGFMSLTDVRVMRIEGKGPTTPHGRQITVREGDVLVHYGTHIWTARQIEYPDWWTK